MGNNFLMKFRSHLQLFFPRLMAAIVFLCPIANGQTIDIKTSINATPGAGGRLGVGQVGRTGAGGVLNGSMPWSGVKGITVMPRSTIKLREYGFTGNGGRFSTFDCAGECYFRVLTTNPNSRVRACFKNYFGQPGCALLRSSVRIKDDLIAVREGSVIAQDEMEATPPQTIRTGQYSMLLASGAFSTPMAVFGQRGYSLERKLSRTVGLFRAWPGWTFFSGDRTVQGPIGTPWQVISPLVEPDLP
jgi:hypothetical protein